jgi:hypothetical protein
MAVAHARDGWPIASFANSPPAIARTRKGLREC